MVLYKPVLKYPGSKWNIAQWIVSHMPRHHSYLEPFFGSGAVFFSKPPSRIETINDLDGNVINLFKVIRDKPKELARLIAATPYSRYEYDQTFVAQPDNELEKARQFLVQCWQGHGFRTNGYKVGWKNDVQGRERAYALWNWNRLPDWILAATQRLKQAQIENMPAIELIQRFRFSEVLIYADPPYVLSTKSGKAYKHEMTDEEHVELLDVLDKHPGPVLLSGYSCELYDTRLKHWEKKTIKALAEKGRAREEVLWINPVAAEKLNYSLFKEMV